MTTFFGYVRTRNAAPMIRGRVEPTDLARDSRIGDAESCSLGHVPDRSAHVGVIDGASLEVAVDSKSLRAPIVVLEVAAPAIDIQRHLQAADSEGKGASSLRQYVVQLERQMRGPNGWRRRESPDTLERFRSTCLRFDVRRDFAPSLPDSAQGADRWIVLAEHAGVSSRNEKKQEGSRALWFAEA